MITIRQVLQEKGSAVWTISPDAKLREALKLLAEKEIGALVVSEKGKVVGIISERDYARHSVNSDITLLDNPVRSIMTEEVYVVKPDQGIDECMGLMTARHFRHLPVMEGDRLVGIISIGDVVKQIISEKDFMIHNLENYILGRGYVTS